MKCKKLCVVRLRRLTGCWSCSVWMFWAYFRWTGSIFRMFESRRIDFSAVLSREDLLFGFLVHEDLFSTSFFVTWKKKNIVFILLIH